jgi:hypothetical protein
LFAAAGVSRMPASLRSMFSVVTRRTSLVPFFARNRSMMLRYVRCVLSLLSIQRGVR